ncbi:MAG: glycosyltransferase family 4 protein [Anaerolineae bacterium]|nr:glycosyltransferase family 4 protein [Anaerolineae bacterium]
MTRIGIDSRLTYYREGGIAAYTRHVIEALAALDSTTDYRILQNFRDRRHPLPAPNFRRVPTFTPSHNRLEKWALALEITPLRLDLLHSPDFIPPLWGARRTVITIHDLNFLHYPEFLTAESRRYYNDQIERAVRQADHILACSEATRRDLAAMLGVPEGKITVHLEGVDAAFKPLPEAALTAARQQLDLPQDYLLFVGTFEPRKNISGLLEAYHLLRQAFPEALPLVLAGRRGWLYEEIFARVESLGLRDHILWRENIPQALMPALYNAARLLVMPSFYEGFGLPPLEAMACGTPTVVADRSSLPEVVGEAGLLVNPDDPADIAAGLERLLADPALHADLSAKGIRRAGTFTWQRTAETVLQTYRRVLQL